MITKEKAIMGFTLFDKPLYDDFLNESGLTLDPVPEVYVLEPETDPKLQLPFFGTINPRSIVRDYYNLRHLYFYASIMKIFDLKGIALPEHNLCLLSQFNQYDTYHEFGHIYINQQKKQPPYEYKNACKGEGIAEVIAIESGLLSNNDKLNYEAKQRRVLLLTGDYSITPNSDVFPNKNYLENHLKALQRAEDRLKDPTNQKLTEFTSHPSSYHLGYVCANSLVKFYQKEGLSFKQAIDTVISQPFPEISEYAEVIKKVTSA